MSGRIRLAAVGALLICAPVLAFAAGLGRLTVLSALGQALDAEIEIVSLMPGEEEGLTVRLAPPEAFRQAGIELSPVLLGARFSIERRAGRPYVRMRTAQPVNEPFLDVLIELQWATGRLVREYTFLLDPPEYRVPVPVAAAPAPAAEAEAARAAPPPKIEARPVSPAAEPLPRAAGTHEVKRGETLGAIARRNLAEGVTLNQMLIALFRANQDAFIRGNINLVRAGRILSVPGRESVMAVDAAEAERIVRSHAVEFAEYRRTLGAAVAAAPAAPQPPTREAVGRITPKAEAPTPVAPRDELRLSRVDPANPAAAASRAAIEDDRVARERALREAQSRIAELERNVADLQKLLELKSQQLAALERKAAAAVKAEPPAKPATEVAKAPEAAKPIVEPAKAPEAAKAVAEAAKAPEPAKAVTEAAKAPEPAKAVAEAAKAPEPAKAAAKPQAGANVQKPKAAPPKAPEPDFADQVRDFVTDPVSGGGLAAVLLLLAGYALWQVRRRRAAQPATVQDSVLGAASGAGAPSVFGAAAQPAASPVAGAAAAAGRAAQAPAAAETEELDPIAEADVYMAYGRYAQAEEILREALAKNPDRIPVHAKLLEVYANQKNVQAFERTVLKMKSLTGASGPEWEKAIALGHSLAPSNPLYATSAAVPAEPLPAAGVPALDFDLGVGASEAVADRKSPDVTMPLDFDLGAALAPGAEPATADLSAPLAGSEQPMTVDFDLDLGEGETKAGKAAAEEPRVDLGAIRLDLGEPGAPAGEADAKWRSMSEKLELSKAYLDIGHKEEARELLDEVAREGDATQQARAREMLAGLG